MHLPLLGEDWREIAFYVSYNFKRININKIYQNIFCNSFENYVVKECWKVYFPEFLHLFWWPSPTTPPPLPMTRFLRTGGEGKGGDLTVLLPRGAASNTHKVGSRCNFPSDMFYRRGTEKNGAKKPVMAAALSVPCCDHVEKLHLLSQLVMSTCIKAIRFFGLIFNSFRYRK
jgi:hypothetical protein